jgi:3-oxoacyl-[acyl-carrier protein] reductase
MDLGLYGQRAVVCGASRGIGFACAEALAAEGASLTLVARHRETLDSAADRLGRRYGAAIRTVAADLATAEGCATVSRTVPDTDILVTNCGGAPAGSFSDFTRRDWLAAIELNMLSALDLIAAYLPGMRRRGHGRIVNILNVALQGGYPDLPLSSGAVAGLAGAIASIAHPAARDNVAINSILPGRFETERLAANIAHDIARTGLDETEIRNRRLGRQSVQRFGDPREIGELCAFLCGRSAGYLVGQQIVMDGGAYPYAT